MTLKSIESARLTASFLIAEVAVVLFLQNYSVENNMDSTVRISHMYEETYSISMFSSSTNAGKMPAS